MKNILRHFRTARTKAEALASRPNRLALEHLEARDVPAVVFVDDSLIAGNTIASLGGRVTLDRDSDGFLSAGDQVTFALGETGQTVNLTFGQAAVGGDVGTAFGTGSVFVPPVGATATGAIPSAITFATDGDTIQVARGVYSLSDPITINKALTILGAQAGVDARPSAGTTRVIGSANESVVDVNGLSQGFVITASNVTIDGFDVKNATDVVIDAPGNAAFTSAQVRNNIIHNTVTTGGAKGIRLQALANSTIEYNNVFGVADAGIQLGASAAGAAPGSIVRFNEVHDLGFGTGPSSTSPNSAIYAFAVGSTETNLNVTIQGNLVYNHAGNDAIKIGARNGQDRLVSGGSILDNIVHDTAQDGITVNASNTTVRGNEVYNSSSSNGAIYVEHAASGVTIENNYLHDNSAGQAAVLVGFSGRPASPTGMVVRFNSIVNNTNNVIFYRDNTGGTATLDASFNWYGSSAQATVAASVKSTAGAVATANRIDFTPWLNNGTDADTVAPGFQPNFLGLTVAPSTVSLQTGSSGRIQEAIDQAATGATINVLNGTYVEDVNVNKSVSVLFAGGTVTGKVSGVSGAALTAQGTLSLGDGSTTGVNFAGSLSVGTQSVALLDSDAAVLDGTTNLSGGTLTAANGISSGASALLTGTGTVLAAVATAGAVSPGGAAVGTLSTGNVTFTGTGQFAADVDAASSDQLAATGTVTLGGAALVLTGLGAPTVGQSFTLIDNDGVDAISGTFAGLAEGAIVNVGGAFFQISYVGGTNGNDVVLTTVAGVSITANDASAAETTAPATANDGQFTVTRTGDTTADLTVFYTISGTATNGADYTLLSGSVVIPAGQSSAVIDVSVINDAISEVDETVTVTLTPDVNYALAPGSAATVTIADNEAEVSITANDASAGETAAPAAANGGQFTVTRTGDTSAPLTVLYTISGTAANGTDYTTLAGSVVIPAGQSSAVIDISVINDALTEGDETVTLALTANAAYTVASPMGATVTITDNEPEVSITATDANAAETTGAANGGQFTVTRTGDTTAPLTVSYTISGTATNGTDYTTLTGSVVIPAGQSSAVIDVSVLNDAVSEGDETVTVGLTANASYTLAGPTDATVTIADPEPAVNVTNATTNEDVQSTSGLVVTATGPGAGAVTHFKVTGITNGTLFLNDGTTPVNNGDFITVAQAGAGLKFTPAADFNGATSFTLQASLGASDAGLDGTTATATITVDPVNDAPSFVVGSNQTVPQDSGAQSVSGFASGFSAGPANEAAQTVLAYEVVSNSNPALFSSAPTVAANGTLTYTPAPGAFGTATITLLVRDSGGTANGGTDASVVKTFTITVTEVEDTTEQPQVFAPAPAQAVLAIGHPAGIPAVAQLVDASTGALRVGVAPFGGFLGGITVAAGDVNGDGIDDLVVGAGAGGNGHVKVFDGRTGAEIRSFLTFPGFNGAVTVASGDVDGDGIDDIIVGAGAGAPGGHVKVFSGTNGTELKSFFAYDAGFLGGVSVAVGDVNMDGYADILTGSGAGAPNGHVKVFDGLTGGVLASFFAYTGFNGGVLVASGDIDGDGAADVVTLAGGTSHVKLFGRSGNQRASIFAFPSGTQSVRLAVLDANKDGTADVVTTGRTGTASQLKAFGGDALAEIAAAFALPPSAIGAIEVG